MELYEQFIQRKAIDQKLDFNEISYDELKALWFDEMISDKMIAQLFNVSKGAVTYKRKKWSIDRSLLVKTFIHDDLKNNNKLNQEAKERINIEYTVDSIAKAITHFAFRNGPIETMHAQRQLTQSDMKILNKFMVNRLYYVFSLIFTGRWVEFNVLLDKYRKFGAYWDEAELDDGGIAQYIEHVLMENRDSFTTAKKRRERDVFPEGAK